MSKGNSKKKIQVKEFADILFTILAPQLLYEDVRENFVISKSLRDFSNSILMISYAYRPVFREKFRGVLHFLTRNIKSNPMLYAYTLAEILSNNYSDYKFLVWCSFVSELHFYLCESQADKKEEYYVEQASLAFRDIFNLTFDVCFFKKPQRWIHVFWTASKISARFTLLKPFINKGTLNKPLFFLNLIQRIIVNNVCNNVPDPSGSAPQMSLDHNLTEPSLQEENEKSVSTPETSCEVVKTACHYSDEKDSPAAGCSFSDRKQKRRSSSNESTESVSPAMKSLHEDKESSSNSRSKKRRKRTVNEMGIALNFLKHLT